MSKKKYKKELIESLKLMAKSEHQLLEKMTNLMLLGELKNDDIEFNEGDTFTFKDSIFNYSNDKNIRRLAKLRVKTLKTLNKMVNKNKFKDKEVEFLA